MGDQRRARRDGQRGRRARPRPGHDRAQGPPAARQDVPGRQHPGSHPRRRRDQARPGDGRAVRGVARRRPDEPVDAARPRTHGLHAGLGAPSPADVRLHRGGAEDPHRADGPHRRRADRLDGHRHADRAAVDPSPAALRLLHPAFRAGHEPAARRDPRGTGHQRGGHDRPGGQPAGAGPGELSPRRAAVPGDRQRRTRQAPQHRRRRRQARVQGGAGLRPVQAARRREGHEGAARRDPARRVRGDRRRGAHPRPLRPRLDARPGPDPVAAAHRRPAPAPDLRADAYPGKPDRRVGRLPRGAPRGGAARVRRIGDQPVPGVRDRRGPDPGGHHHRHRARQGGAQLRQGARQGRPEDHVEDGHLDRLVLRRCPGVRGGRTRARVRAAVLHRHLVEDRRHQPRRGARGGQGKARQGVPGQRRRARPPAARGRRRVPVAPRGRTAPVQPADGVPPPARHPQPPVRRLPAVHRRGRPARDRGRLAARPVRAAHRAPAAGAARRGRAGQRDRQAVRHRRHVVRVDLGGVARGARDRDEPPRRQVEHRRGRRGRRAALRPGPAVRRQAGCQRPVRRHHRVPGARRRHPDQDGAGRQARRGRPATREQGVAVDREDPLRHAGRRAHLAAAAPRHLLDRRPRPARLRPEERQPGRAHPRQVGERGRCRHGRRRRGEDQGRRHPHLGARRRHRCVAR